MTYNPNINKQILHNYASCTFVKSNISQTDQWRENM